MHVIVLPLYFALYHLLTIGNKVYRGFLYLEHTYNNPVANAFVAMLIDGSGHQKEKGALHFKGIRE